MTDKILNFLSSLRLAVFIIISLGILSAIGTIYEARYDSEYAQKVIYHSKYMYTVLILLCVNLIFVMVDRWPWQRKHIGFLMAHIGIITTLVGAYITQKTGVDGSMSFPIGEKNRYVTIGGRELIVYSAFAGGQPTRMFETETDFFGHSPQDEPLKVNLGADNLVIKEYYHYSVRDEKFQRSKNKNSGPAIRFQLQNSRVNLTEWIYKSPGKTSEKLELGPAEVVLTEGKYEYKGGNVIVFRPAQQNQVNYEIYLDRKKGMISKGVIEPGESLNTGWMDLNLRFLNYYPSAEHNISYREVERPTPLTRSAIGFEFNGARHWLGINSLIKLYTADKVYYVTWGNRRLDLGFDITLSDFRVGRYQGTRRAKAYESDVEIKELGKVTISMNEPLKHEGFTFYQASFEEDEKGQPTTSVLSVNKDPGRPLKYIGSFLLVLGSIILFYFRKLKVLNQSSKPGKKRKSA